MAAINSDGIGHVDYAPEEVYWFDSGIPAFEHLRRWLLVERAMFRPLAVLQSIEQPDLRFACLPVAMLQPDYCVNLGVQDRRALELDSAGGEVDRALQGPLICLAILTFRAGKCATANLLAPILLNPQARKGAQVVQSETQYSAEFELLCRQAAQPEAPRTC